MGSPASPGSGVSWPLSSRASPGHHRAVDVAPQLKAQVPAACLPGGVEGQQGRGAGRPGPGPVTRRQRDHPDLVAGPEPAGGDLDGRRQPGAVRRQRDAVDVGRRPGRCQPQRRVDYRVDLAVAVEVQQQDPDVGLAVREVLGGRDGEGAVVARGGDRGRRPGALLGLGQRDRAQHPAGARVVHHGAQPRRVTQRDIEPRHADRVRRRRAWCGRAAARAGAGQHDAGDHRDDGHDGGGRGQPPGREPQATGPGRAGRGQPPPAARPGRLLRDLKRAQARGLGPGCLPGQLRAEPVLDVGQHVSPPSGLWPALPGRGWWWTGRRSG
jgi:hypothetical protein